ncbi:hypothetical protein DYH09_34980 [bacterium CPR1]|nr:hypothetical protein [bacterium CPR1]
MRHLLVLFGILVCAAAAQNFHDPRVYPEWPTTPPPTIAPGATAPDPARMEGLKKSFPSYQGWSVVVFPFARLTAARGYPRMLLSLGPAGFTQVDPVNHPEQVDTSQAYITFFDQAGQVSLVGQAQAGKRITDLHPGWNLLAVPSSTPVAVEHITVTAPGGLTRTPGEAASDSLQPGNAWLYALGLARGAEGRVNIDLRQPRSPLVKPGTAALIYSWGELELNWNLVPPATVPRIAGLSSSSLTPGQVLQVKGSGFGQPGHGTLTLGGLPVPPDSVVEWKSEQIRFKIPEGARSGNLMVMVDRYPSNRVAVTVAPGAGQATSTLTGRVESSDRQPLGGAQVQLDSGYQATTSADGSFQVQGLPPGPHDVFVSKVGYRSGKGSVRMAPGESRNLLVSLSPAGGQAVRAEKKANFTVRGYPYDLEGEGVDGRHYWVYKMEVWEYGTNGRNWSRTWDTDVGNSYNELTCDGALVGRYYCMRLYWKSGRRDRTALWTPQLDNPDQVFYYYHP